MVAPRFPRDHKLRRSHSWEYNCKRARAHAPLGLVVRTNIFRSVCTLASRLGLPEMAAASTHYDMLVPAPAARARTMPSHLLAASVLPTILHLRLATCPGSLVAPRVRSGDWRRFRWTGLLEGGGQVRQEGRRLRLCEALAGGRDLGPGRHVRQRGVHPEEVDAPGVAAGREYARRVVVRLGSARAAEAFVGDDGDECSDAHQVSQLWVRPHRPRANPRPPPSQPPPARRASTRHPSARPGARAATARSS